MKTIIIEDFSDWIRTFGVQDTDENIPTQEYKTPSEKWDAIVEDIEFEMIF